MCAARNAVGKSDIFDEPALRGTSGETGDSVNREAVFGDVSRPDVSDSGGIGDEPALSSAAAAEESSPAARESRASVHPPMAEPMTCPN